MIGIAKAYYFDRLGGHHICMGGYSSTSYIAICANSIISLTVSVAANYICSMWQQHIILILLSKTFCTVYSNIVLQNCVYSIFI
jgi:hypothetical protein